jgi:hypothetical protein
MGISIITQSRSDGYSNPLIARPSITGNGFEKVYIQNPQQWK